MDKVNRWGRKYKEKIQISFKKDQKYICDFLNDQPDILAYIKNLVLEDYVAKGYTIGKYDHEHKPSKIATAAIKEVSYTVDTPEEYAVNTPAIDPDQIAMIKKMMGE